MSSVGEWQVDVLKVQNSGCRFMFSLGRLHHSILPSLHPSVGQAVQARCQSPGGEDGLALASRWLQSFCPFFLPLLTTDLGYWAYMSMLAVYHISFSIYFFFPQTHSTLFYSWAELLWTASNPSVECGKHIKYRNNVNMTDHKTSESFQLSTDITLQFVNPGDELSVCRYLRCSSCKACKLREKKLEKVWKGEWLGGWL